MSAGHLLVRAQGVRARTVMIERSEVKFGVTDNAGFWLLVTLLEEGREALSLT